MPPRTSLQSFLTTAKNTLRSHSPQSSPVTLVIGNESADLDSLCSAVILAYIRTYTSNSLPQTLYIPLSNLPSSDLSLRPELHPVLSSARLSSTDLISLSDLPSPLPANQTKWILVDHNALQGQLGQTYSSRLAGCIDHHDEENAVPSDCGSEPRIVRKSGSCSSLVVEYCREAWDALAARSTGSEEKGWDAEMAKLALAPILIDTTNLTQESKTTDTDREGVRYLEEKIRAVSGEYDRTKYFDEITRAKEEIGRLSLGDILRKDYKQWTERDSQILGISSVVKDMSFLLEKAGGKEKFFDAVSGFAKERNLSLCCIMTTSNPDGVFHRQLLVWALDKKVVDAAKKFEAEATKKLGLESWNQGDLDLDDGHQWRRCWWQNNIENSRKQVAPLLRSII